MTIINLRDALRMATDAQHHRLDEKFAAFDLSDRAGLAAFLRAHHRGVAAIQAPVAAFAVERLDGAMPDYAAMLASGLDALGQDVPQAGGDVAEMPSTKCSRAGLAYVMLGSRMGIATLHAQLAKGKDEGHPEAALPYLSDRSGLALWQSFLRWSRQAEFSAGEVAQAVEAARLGFRIFDRAATKELG